MYVGAYMEYMLYTYARVMSVPRAVLDIASNRPYSHFSHN